MTADIRKIKHKKRATPHKWERLALALVFLFILLLLLKNPEIAITNMTSGLSLCAKTLIPSLFPFMVISEIMINSDAMSLPIPLLGRLSKKIFGVGSEGAAAALMGLLCGFPIGAKCASALWKSGKIDRDEYSRLLIISNNPSPAFMIGTVGESMFGERPFGIALYFISVLSALTVGAIYRLISRKTDSSTDLTPNSELPDSRTGVNIFTGAVTASALSMLYVCAYVVFFSTLVGAAESVLPPSVPKWANALGIAFLELTGGMWRASGIENYGKYIAAFAAGWSGLSVHFQIMSICANDGVSFKPYFLAKLATGVLCFMLVGLFLLFF